MKKHLEIVKLNFSSLKKILAMPHAKSSRTQVFRSYSPLVLSTFSKHSNINVHIIRELGNTPKF